MKTCPVCTSEAGEEAFFCESCGYDYLTGAKPRDLPESVAGTVQDTAAEEPVVEEPELDQEAPARPVSVLEISAEEVDHSRENVLYLPEVTPPESGLAPPPAAPAVALEIATPQVQTAAPVADQIYDAPPGQQIATEPPAAPPQQVAPASAGTPARHSPVQQTEPPIEPAVRPDNPEARPEAPAQPAKPPASWVAEIWIDPEWYRIQQAPDQLPSPGQPVIVGLRQRQIIIGRHSPSNKPDIDCGTDSGVSRRHAALTFDGQRWFIEDAGSSNGTYIGQVDHALPTEPITGRVELGPHQRVYVGSWTRIVVRPALLEEGRL